MVRRELPSDLGHCEAAIHVGQDRNLPSPHSPDGHYYTPSFNLPITFYLFRLLSCGNRLPCDDRTSHLIDRPGRGSLWRHAEISLWKGTSMKRLLRSNRYRAETNVPASPTIPCIQPQIVSDSPVPWHDLGDRQRCRIALYSHDTMGLGHMRRNLLIAQTLACSSLPAD